MTIQFPDTPSQGDTFEASNGVLYTYDGGGGLNDLYVEVAGDTMTGDLNINAKATSVSTEYSDPDNTLVTKDYVDEAVGNVAGSMRGAFKNLLINTGPDIWQRGKSSLSLAGTGRYSADMWLIYGTAPTAQAEDAPFGFGYSLRVAGDNTQVGTIVELPAAGEAGLFTVGQTFTLSFWSNRDLTTSSETTSKLYFRDRANSSTNQIQCADEVSYIKLPDEDGSSPTGADFSRYSCTFTINAEPNSTNLMLNIRIPGANSFSNTSVRYCGLQFEMGDVATSYESKPIQIEQALCDRYYQRYKSLRAVMTRTSSTTGEHKVANIPLRQVMQNGSQSVSYEYNNFTSPGSGNTTITTNVDTVSISSSSATPGGTSTLTNITISAEL
jgi:hypothetical protein